MTEPQRKRVQILPFIGLCLLAGALARGVTAIGGESTANAQMPVQPPPENAALSESSPPADHSSNASSSPPSGEINNQLAARLAEAREALDARERDLETRESLLVAIEARLDQKAADLNEERAALEALQMVRQEAQAEEFESLANAYERMKPREAARIFEALGDDILVPVAARMRTQALAGVLAEMAPDNAQALTRKLALRGATTDAAVPSARLYPLAASPLIERQSSAPSGPTP